MSYLFSIIIPVYNSESFLSITIDSILRQNLTNYEIILVNDSSIDNTKKICEAYKKKFNNIKLINKNINTGVGDSRNKGIKFSTGKYVVFVDSDDGLFNNSLLSLKKEIEDKNEPDVIVVHYVKDTFPQSNYQLIQDNINNNNNSEDLITYLDEKKFPFADCWSFVCKRSFVISNNIYFPEIRIGESELFVSKLICFMKNFSFMPDKFYDKKDRDFSLNHTQGYEAAKSTLILLIEFLIFNNNIAMGKIKHNFNNAYIEDAFGIFSSLLILMDSKEIKNLSKILDKNKSNLKNFIKVPERINLEKLILEFGSYDGLIKFRETIINNKYDSVKGKLNKCTKIYAYCRHKYTAATIKLLQNKGYNVVGVIDDNKSYNNSLFLDFKTINSQKFFEITQNNMSDVLVIITHQREKTLIKITDNLIKNGLHNNQIVKFKY